MIYLVDCDQNGLDSVRRTIERNPDKIVVINGGIYEDTDKILGELVADTGPDDLFIFDTIDAYANTLRADAKLGTTHSESLWAYKAKWLEGDKNYQTVYDMAEKMIMRRIKNLRNKGARIIALCHETEKLDETDMLRKRGPDLNDKFYGKLISASSDVFRLSTQMGDIANSAGEIVVPHDARILELRRTPEVIAKFHVDMEDSPKIKPKMVNPTLPKLYEHLGKKPSFLTVYGSPGAGKTTFALSELWDVPKTDAKTKKAS